MGGRVVMGREGRQERVEKSSEVPIIHGHDVRVAEEATTGLSDEQFVM